MPLLRYTQLSQRIESVAQLHGHRRFPTHHTHESAQPAGVHTDLSIANRSHGIHHHLSGSQSTIAVTNLSKFKHHSRYNAV